MKKFEDFIKSNELLYKDILYEVDKMSGHGLLRIFLSPAEIKACNQMVKLGYLDKGISDEKNGTTAFFITRKGEEYLENA